MIYDDCADRCECAADLFECGNAILGECLNLGQGVLYKGVARCGDSVGNRRNHSGDGIDGILGCGCESLRQPDLHVVHRAAKDGDCALQCVGDRSGHRAECAVCIVEVIGQGLPLAAAICRGGVQAGDQVVQGIDMLFAAKGCECSVSLFLGHVLGSLVYDPDGFGQSDELSVAVKSGNAELVHHFAGLPCTRREVVDHGVQGGSGFRAFDTSVGKHTEGGGRFLNRNVQVFHRAADRDVCLHQHLCGLVGLVVGHRCHVEIFAEVVNLQTKGRERIRHKVGAGSEVHLRGLRKPEDGFQSCDGLVHIPSGEAHVTEGLCTLCGSFCGGLAHIQCRLLEAGVIVSGCTADGCGVRHCLIKVGVCTDGIANKLADLEGTPCGGCYGGGFCGDGTKGLHFCFGGPHCVVEAAGY